MAMKAEEVEALLTREGSGLTPDEFDEATETTDSQQHRTTLLAPVLSTCQQLWKEGSEDLDLIAQKLGDGSRDAAWRLPYGDSGILEFFLGVIAVDNLRPALQVHTLRLIGNSCADTDENRARVVEGNHMIFVIRRLRDETIIPFTVPVLYNMLVDYEPAQLHASEISTSQYLIDLLSSPNIGNFGPYVSYIAKTLILLTTQEGEAKRANPLTAQTLLELATKKSLGSDVGDFCAVVSAAVAYLADETFQLAMLESKHLPLLLAAINHAHTSFNLEDLEDPDEKDSLKATRSGLQTVLADITARDEYPTHYPLGSAVPETLLSWLQGTNTSLVSAACFALGNLSRSDETSTALVSTHSAHKPLVKLITDSTTSDPQLLHSTLSFLKNLAIPKQNKAALGELLEPTCVPRIFSIDTLPQVQFSAVSLTRLLLVNCPSNVPRVCLRLSEGEDQTILSNLCALFERTDAEPTKMEASRAVATLCRIIHSNPVEPLLSTWAPQGTEKAPDNDGKRREYFYSKHNLAGPLAFLVSQQKWPSIRSEAWFIFALMCRSREGSGVIDGVLSDEKAMSSLTEAITGRPTDSSSAATDITGTTADGDGSEAVVLPGAGGLQLEPQQVDPTNKANMAKVDRENAVVLCQELLRYGIDDLSPEKASTYRDLVKEGTEKIVAERSQSS